MFCPSLNKTKTNNPTQENSMSSYTHLSKRSLLKRVSFNQFILLELSASEMY